MIRAPFDRPEVLARLRPTYLAQHHLILPGAAEIKKNFFSFAPFFVANRGRYEVAKGKNPKELQRFAEALTGARLKFAWLRAYRFRRGGYALTFDDAQTRVLAGVEVTLDLSNEMIGPPAVYQSPERPRLEIPQAPGLVAIVERGPSTFRYDKYLPASVGRRTVIRLRAAYVFAD